MSETYLGGLSDLTGELVRIARKHNDQTKQIHDYIAKIYDSLIPISITRNSQVRSKLEAVSNNLKKLEDIMYDLKLRDKI
jgi:predicted translin family RNA/ssDNA-binding protein